MGMINEKIILIDTGELSDNKEIAKKQILKMKWPHKLQKYVGEEVAKMFKKIAKEHLTLKKLDELWEIKQEYKN
jgi:hypothetical protein